MVFKKKWSAQDGAFHEPEQKKTVVNTALNEWAQRERITKENKQRMENMKLRAKLLGFNYVEQNKFLIDREPVQVPLEEQDACECVYKDLKCSGSLVKLFFSLTFLFFFFLIFFFFQIFFSLSQIIAVSTEVP